MGGSARAKMQFGQQLGHNIAQRRRALSWTQAELAERVGVEAETVSRFERGATLPSLPKLEQLARALKTRSAELLAESSTERTDQAIRIAAWLDGVADRDRAFVVEQIKRLCDHLRRKS
jgi:transcriptional regulator with XRE-family HTH domain